MQSTPPLFSRTVLTWLLIFALLLLFTYNIRAILLPFVVGILMAYFLDPAADKMQRTGMGRGVAAVIITVSFFTLVIAAAGIVVPMAAHQSAELVAAIPDYLKDIQATYSNDLENYLARFGAVEPEAIREAVSNFAGGILKLAGGVLAGVFHSGMAIVNILSLLLITPLVAFYLLRDWDALTHRVDNLLPRAHAETIRGQMHEIDTTLAGFIRGQLNVCFILAVYYGVLLSIVDLQFGLLIGIFSGLIVILPYVGFLFSFLVAMAVALFQFELGLPFFLVFAIYMGGQLIESYFLTPKLVGDRVGLHPLWIIFGMLAGGALFGFTGVLLALPVTAIAGVLIRFTVSRYLQSSLYLSR